MRALQQRAGHDLLVRPFAGDFYEVQGRLSASKEVTLEIPYRVLYPSVIVSAVPVVTATGARAGAFVLPTIDDVNVSLRSKEGKYNFGERSDEGETSAANSRISLRAFAENATLLRLELGKQTGTSELIFQFGWRDFPTVAAANLLPCLVSLTLGLQRLDNGSENS